MGSNVGKDLMEKQPAYWEKALPALPKSLQVRVVAGTVGYNPLLSTACDDLPPIHSGPGATPPKHSWWWALSRLGKHAASTHPSRVIAAIENTRGQAAEGIPFLWHPGSAQGRVLGYKAVVEVAHGHIQHFSIPEHELCYVHDGRVLLSETVLPTPHQCVLVPAPHGTLLLDPLTCRAVVDFFSKRWTDLELGRGVHDENSARDSSTLPSQGPSAAHQTTNSVGQQLVWPFLDGPSTLGSICAARLEVSPPQLQVLHSSRAVASGPSHFSRW